MIYDRKLHASKPALPEGYEKAFTIDLQIDKKTYLIVNLSALAVAADAAGAEASAWIC